MKCTRLTLSWSSEGQSFQCVLEYKHIGLRSALKLAASVHGVEKAEIATLHGLDFLTIKLAESHQKNSMKIAIVVDALAKRWGVKQIMYVDPTSSQLLASESVSRDVWLRPWTL